MSTTIDSRVVEMRFDNKQFEKNCSETMSTLDKLKQKLHLDGASKGLENVNSAAKKVDMDGLGKSVENVRSKFSALEVMGVTALANITNSAVNAGKRILSSLTIDPVRTGLSEYELKMGSIQTIMASTGEDLQTVNKYLNELNEYSDQTIYSFSDMTQNIGKFTNAGVKLEDAVLAIKGISNEAAISGANANEASRAMYNFAQALSAGYVKLIDWKSIENANMATVEFKTQLLEAAVAAGTVKKTSDGMYKVLTKNNMGGTMDLAIDATKNFNDSLNYQWMTTEVLVSTLKDYADETTDIGKKAKAAATEIKTVSMLYDTLKESAQSGWAQTWEFIIGDFEQAKETLTKLGEYLGGIIGGWADIRNSLVGGAFNMDKPWGDIIDKIGKSDLGKITEITEKVENVTEKLKVFQAVVDKVWRGDFGNVDTGRFEGLEEAGYDSRVIQELVNLGSEYELTVEDVEKAHKKFGLTMDKNVTMTKKVTSATKDLSDEQLKSAGLTEGEIRLYRALADEAERTGKSIGEVAKEMSEKDGRSMLIESFKNAWSGLLGILKAVKNAWTEIFPPMTVVQLYNIIKAVNEFSEKLRLTDKETGELTETAKKLQRTFKGIFAIIDIIVTILGGGLKIAIKAVTQLCSYLGIDILTLTANIGDAIVKFRDWIDKSLDFTKVFEKIIPPIVNAITAFREWIAALKNSENLPRDIAQGIAKGLGGILKYVSDIFKQLLDFVKSGFKNVPKFMNQGLIKGIWDGIKTAGQVIIELGKILLEKICGVLGIHSPSTKFFEIGKNIILGLVNGIKEGASLVWDAIKGVGQKCIDIIKSIDLGTIFAGVLVGGGLLAVSKVATAVTSLAAPLAGLGDMFEEFGDAAKQVGKGVKNYLNSKALLSIAVAIGILALSVIKLAEIKPGRLWATIGAIAALAAIIIALTFVMGKFNTLQGVNVSPKAILAVLAIAGAMFILTLALAKLARIDESTMKTTLIMFGSLLVGILVLSKACSGNGVIKMGGTLLAISATLLILTGVIAIIGKLDGETLLKGLIVIGLFEIFVITLALIGRNAGSTVKVGGTLLGIATTLLVLTAVFAIMDKLSMSGIAKGLFVLAALGVFIAVLIGISGLATKGRKSGQMIVKLGGVMGALGFALLAFAAVVAILDKFDTKAILKGVAAVALMGALFVALILVSKKTGKDTGKVGVMLLGMSAAMLVLAGVIYIISLLKPEAIIKGLTVVLLLGGMMALIVHEAKNAKKAMGTIIAITAALVLLVGAIVVLSLIDQSQLLPAVAAVSILLLSFATLLAGLGKLSGAKSLWKKILPMMALLVVLAGIIWALGALETKNAIENAAGISIFMIAMATACKIMNKVSRINKTAISGLFALAGVSIIAGLVLAMMGALRTDNAIVNAIALGIFMNTMASALKIANKVSINKTAMTGMYALAGVSIIAGLVLAMMGALKTKNAIVNAIALGIFMNTMATALKIMNKVSINKNVIPGMLAMSACTAIAGLVLAMMSALKTQNAIQNAIGLGIFMNAMATALLITSMVETVSWTAIAALAVMVIVAALGGLVLAMMSALGCENAISNAIALSVFITAMTVALILCSVAGMLAGFAMPGIAALAVFILAVGALVGAIGYLMEQFPELEKFIDNGLPILEKLGEGVGKFAGNIVGGLLEGVTDSLPKVGENLSAFGENLNPFLNAINGLDSDSALGIKYLAEAMLTLTGGGIMDALTSWFTGGNSLEKFGEALNTLGPYMVSYSGYAKQVNGEAIKNSATALDYMIAVAKKIPNSGGWAGAIMGENDIDAFGKKLFAFGNLLVGYSRSISTLTDENLKSIEKSAKTSEKLTDMAKTIPNSGGWAGAIMGENDLDEFGRKLFAFGNLLVSYSVTVSSLTDADITNIERSVVTSQKLIDMAKTIPNSGGWAGAIMGENDLDEFGRKLFAFGDLILQYSSKINELDDNDIANIERSVTASQRLIDMCKTIPESGGIFSVFTSNNDADNFGTKLYNYAVALVNYSKKVAELDTISIDTSVAATGKIISALPSADYSSIEIFTNDIKSLGNSLKTYSGINSEGMSNVTTELKSLITTATQAAGKDFSGLGSLTQSLGKLGEEGVNAFISAFDGIDSRLTTVGNTIITALTRAINNKKDKFKTAGKTLINKLVEGINDSKKDAKTASGEVASEASDKIKTEEYFESFKSVGSYLIAGLISGINSKKDEAIAAAEAIATAIKTTIATAFVINSPSKWGKETGGYVGEGLVIGLDNSKKSVYDSSVSLATATITAIKKTLDIHSPARVTRALADYAGAGYVEGMKESTDEVYDASAAVGEASVNGVTDGTDGLESALDNLKNVIGNSDAGSGEGTLIDLTSMGSGDLGLFSDTGGLGDMFGGDFDVLGMTDSINMDLSNLTGDNDDILDKLDEVVEAVGSSGGSTYNINGITYAGNSDLDDAVRIIVRAAKVERRR